MTDWQLHVTVWVATISGMPNTQPSPTDDLSHRKHDDRKEVIRAAIAAELRAEIGRLNLDQAQVAELIGMHRVTVNRLLNGQRTLDTEQLFDFADALGFDAGRLLNRAKREYTKKLGRLDIQD